MNGLIRYIKETRGELTHVAWPTQKQTIIFTFLVILCSVATSLYLGLLDAGLTQALKTLLTRFGN